MKKIAAIAICVLTGCTLPAVACNMPANRIAADSVTPLSSAAFIHSYGNLGNFYRCVQQGKVTVTFLGGSITNMQGWRDKVMQYLQEKYPSTQFTFINAGIPSLGSLPHAFRLQRDVLDKGKTDLLFVESAVNDHGNGTPEIQQRRSLEGIVRHALSANPAMNIVMMAFADEDKTADYDAGRVPTEIKVHEDIAAHYHLPFINLAEEVAKRIANKEFTWKDDFKNLHPSPFGQQLYFLTIKALLEQQTGRSVKKVTAKDTLPAPLQSLNYAVAGYRPVYTATSLNNFAIQDNWQPQDSARTRPGFVHVPVLQAIKAGASFELNFTGTAAGIAVLSGPDAGMLEYSIDNGPVKTIDLYTRWSNNLHLPWYLLLGDELEKSTHVLKVKVAAVQNAQSKGTACRIVYFLVND